MNSPVISRTWLDAGEEYTPEGRREEIARAIESLKWESVGPDGVIKGPFSPAHELRAAIEGYGLSRVQAYAFGPGLRYPDGPETATFQLLGLEYERDPGSGRGLVNRLYVLAANGVVPLVEDVARWSVLEPRRGFMVFVLRPANGVDYSLHGVSSRHERAVVVGIRAAQGESEAARNSADRGLAVLPRLFPATEDMPEIELVVRRLAGGLYVHAEPAGGNGRRGVHGGCFVETSDSRFGEMLRAMYGDGRYQVGPIPLHDRYER